MKYVIRKVPERDTSYLERLIPDAIVYCDNTHAGCRDSFEKAILLADDDAVYIQDDMLLCRDFIKKTKAYIDSYPDRVIVFSNRTDSKPTSCVTQEGFWSPEAGLWLMCTYIPQFIAKAFLCAKHRHSFKVSRTVSRYDLDDVEFENFLTYMNDKVFVTVPNLAGHPKNQSVTGYKRPFRVCKNFDYEKAEV